MLPTTIRRFTVSGVSLVLAASLAGPIAGAPAHQAATPFPTYSCDSAAASSPMAGMPAMHHGDMTTGSMASPMAGMAMAFDQMYIDMMIPHHASIIAMAEAALPRLRDGRLRRIAQDVVATQAPEIEELQGYRERFYGSATPAPMDPAMMDAMAQMMPGMGSMEEMAKEMDAAAQVAAVCAAQDADVAFIDLTIPHHRMAIAASEAALGQATHPEIRAFAQKVIDVQQKEIGELTAIRAELTGAATPEATP